MAEKTPAEKLLLKPGMTAALLHVPPETRDGLGVPAGVTVVDEPEGATFILDFVETQAEAEERLAALAPHIGSATVAWLAYPKGSKAAGIDVNRDTIWAFAKTLGLAAVAMVSIDGRWSAMRVRRAGA